MKNKSFTLIELLVVIVIIGILAGVIMISTSSSIDKANIAKLKAFEGSIQNNLAVNMVSRWKLDGDAKDAWGDNHGTVYGATQVDDCVYGKCYSFDGVDDYISIINVNNLELENNGTIVAWIYPTSLTGLRVFYGSSGSADVNKTPYFRLENGVLRAYLGNGNDFNSIDSGYYPKLNSWSFVGISWNGANINIYHNANIKSQNQTYSVKFTQSTYFIGRPSLAFDNRNFAGLIDDVRIFDVALSSSQTKQNYIAGLNSLLAKGGISKEEYNQRVEALSKN